MTHNKLKAASFGLLDEGHALVKFDPHMTHMTHNNPLFCRSL